MKEFPNTVLASADALTIDHLRHAMEFYEEHRNDPPPPWPLEPDVIRAVQRLCWPDRLRDEVKVASRAQERDGPGPSPR